MKQRLASRKLWVAVGSLIAVLLSEVFGLELPTEVVVSMTAIVASYLLGQSLVDAKK